MEGPIEQRFTREVHKEVSNMDYIRKRANQIADIETSEGDFAFWTPRGKRTVRCQLCEAKAMVSRGAVKGGVFTCPGNIIYL
jgi:hypothetical protein